ncbi:hypothetical protein ABTY20_19145 [Streptomyces sp. NPDC126497]|uniref:hypothetical protein n=1 Tax=Streptomyces sp. NPDC126497 TaxID=3155313 RepID=UPI00332E4DEE
MTTAAQHPANLRRRVHDRMDAARLDGDRAAYEAAQTELVRVNAYEAKYLGIPERYVDPETGRWNVPDTVCRACWQDIDGPVFALGVDGSCLHYHPDCRPRYADLPPRPLDILYPAGRQHPRRSCGSQLPYYIG